MWQRFSERARKVVFYAQEEGQRYGEGYVSTEHLLLGLCRERDSTAGQALEELGLWSHQVDEETRKHLPQVDPRPSQDMTLTPRAKRVIDLAYDEARYFNDNFIGTEHLLLGLVREGDGLAARVLAHLDVDLKRARAAVKKVRERLGNPVGSPAPSTLEDLMFTEQQEQRPTLAVRTMPLRRELYSAEFFVLLLLAEPLTETFLPRVGVNASEVRTHLEIGVVGRAAQLASARGQDLSSLSSDGISQILKVAEEECNDQPLDVRHLIIAAFRDDQNAFSKFMVDQGVTIDALRAALQS